MVCFYHCVEMSVQTFNLRDTSSLGRDCKENYGFQKVYQNNLTIVLVSKTIGKAPMACMCCLKFKSLLDRDVFAI